MKECDFERPKAGGASILAGKLCQCDYDDEKEKKWSESDRSWVIPDKESTNASGAKYRAIGIPWS